MHGLPESQFLDELQERYGAIPDAVRGEPELLELLLPVLRADIRAVETYEPTKGAVVRCPVDIYGGSDDSHPRPAQLPFWSRLVTQPIRIRVFDGDHFYLHSQREALTADIAARWTTANVVGTGAA